MTTKGRVVVERRSRKGWVWVYSDAGVQLESNHTFRTADAARRAARTAYPDSPVTVDPHPARTSGESSRPRAEVSASFLGRVLAYALVARALWRSRRR